MKRKLTKAQEEHLEATNSVLEKLEQANYYVNWQDQIKELVPKSRYKTTIELIEKLKDTSDRGFAPRFVLSIQPAQINHYLENFLPSDRRKTLQVLSLCNRITIVSGNTTQRIILLNPREIQRAEFTHALNTIGNGTTILKNLEQEIKILLEDQEYAKDLINKLNQELKIKNKEIEVLHNRINQTHRMTWV